MPPVTILDVNWTGRPRAIAAALLESDGHYAIIDPGPASTLDNLRAELRTHGLSIAELESILLTHIHLDHAGATGALVRENPRLRIYVHQIGALHLEDPSRLLASAGRLWADELQRLFGDVLPVPEQNIHALEGGEKLSLGSKKLDVLYTPGHASHHVTYFDPQEGTAFAGDTAGIRIENGPYIMPATPPPDIDLQLWDASFDAILNRRPTKLFLTHFGFAENPPQHIAKFRNRLQEWASITEKILRSNPTETAALESFLAETRAEMARHLPPTEVDLYAFTAGLPLSFLGLARHLRKRAAS
jgi:glyoxylase-like metal-dependent hydrolase (beta-lactamase superfamily II)